MKKLYAVLAVLGVLAGAGFAATVSELAGEAARLSNEGKKAEAVEKFKSAIALEPNNASLYLHLGLTYKDMGRFDDCVKNVEKAIALGDRDVRTYATLAFTYEALAVSTPAPLSAKPFWEKALAAWNTALTLETDPVKKGMAQKHIERIKDITK